MILSERGRQRHLGNGHRLLLNQKTGAMDSSMVILDCLAQALMGLIAQHFRLMTKVSSVPEVEAPAVCGKIQTEPDILVVLAEKAAAVPVVPVEDTAGILAILENIMALAVEHLVLAFAMIMAMVEKERTGQPCSDGGIAHEIYYS